MLMINFRGGKMKITEVFKAENLGKSFRIAQSGEEFELVELYKNFVLRRQYDLKPIEDCYTLHIILASEFEEVKEDDILDLDGFSLDDFNDNETIDDILALLLG